MVLALNMTWTCSIWTPIRFFCSNCCAHRDDAGLEMTTLLHPIFIKRENQSTNETTQNKPPAPSRTKVSLRGTRAFARVRIRTVCPSVSWNCCKPNDRTTSSASLPAEAHLRNSKVLLVCTFCFTQFHQGKVAFAPNFQAAQTWFEFHQTIGQKCLFWLQAQSTCLDCSSFSQQTTATEKSNCGNKNVHHSRPFF